MLNSNWKEHDPENFFSRKANFVLFYCGNNPYQISCVKFAVKFKECNLYLQYKISYNFLLILIQ